MQTTNTADVIVVGAGVIGCAIARELAGAGCQVTVLERAQVGAEASSAAAGILAPRVHATMPGMFPLAMASHALFAPLVEALWSETGVQTEFSRSPVLDLAFDPDTAAALRAKVDDLQEAGHDVSWLDPAGIREVERALAEGALGAFYDRDAFQVHPARVTQALGLAAARRGVRFELGVEVTGVERRGAHLTTLRTTQGPRSADYVIFATGAWLGHGADWLGFTVPVTPAKGQILTIRALPTPVQNTVFGAEIYLMPRIDGTIVVGATVEHVGYDKSLTASGIGWLLTTLPALCPALADAPIDRMWSGLRPATPDDLPVVGLAPGWDNVVLAGGHFRNGIMLAPITAELVRDLICSQITSDLLIPLDPARFLA